MRLVLSTILLASACEGSGHRKSASPHGQGAPAAPSEPASTAPGDRVVPPADAPTPRPAATPETITFPASDGLEVSADLYLSHGPEAPFIVLFHQAGWSRGEYREIAPRLGALGFNAMAVDQRSGDAVNGVSNLTHERALAKALGTEFLDALPDMRAALGLVAERYPRARRIAWGSSYSAALVLYLAGTEPSLADAVLAFSPGEYFARFGKGKHFIRDAAKGVRAPSFLTSAKGEAGKWRPIADAMPVPPTRFVPSTAGQHGSRALWTKNAGHEAYWQAVEAFLKTLD